MVTLSDNFKNFEWGSCETIVHHCTENVFIKSLYPANQRRAKVENRKRLDHEGTINRIESFLEIYRLIIPGFYSFLYILRYHLLFSRNQG